MSTVRSIAQHIVIPGDGEPRIAGIGLPVQNIVAPHESLGQTPDRIVRALPALTMADVHAALAYYHDQDEEARRMPRGE